MNKNRLILVTTGDADGVGLEVSIKSLGHLGPQAGFNFIVFHSQKKSLSKYRSLKKFKVVTVSDIDSAIKEKATSKVLFEIISSSAPTSWVESAVAACYHKKAVALVTGPLSKQSIISSGRNDIGHTEIIKRITGTKDAFMAFLGSKFNVVLLTGHQSLKSVEDSINQDLFKSCVESVALFLKSSSSKKALPIAVLGLNPHAGDSGLIGDFDEKLKSWIDRLNLPIKVVGPLSPDSAFTKVNFKKFSFFISLYHDQGLIPFKAIHGFEEGAHVTLGVPILRTSVDHGPAKELYGLNKASYGSMVSAIKVSLLLSRRSHV